MVTVHLKRIAASCHAPECNKRPNFVARLTKGRPAPPIAEIFCRVFDLMLLPLIIHTAIIRVIAVCIPRK